MQQINYSDSSVSKDACQQKQHDVTSTSKIGECLQWKNAIAFILFLVTLGYAIHSNAATGQLYANAMTAPGGSVMMGSNLWVSDHVLGFCRLDPDPAPATTFHINQNFCNLVAVSPGQPSFDSTNNFVYVPDNSSKSQGVWRLTFNPTTQTVSNPVRLANGGGGLSGNKATATALAPNGDLYVGFIKNGNILKVTNPAGATTSQVVTIIGSTSDGAGVTAIAFAGNDLYLAEGGAVTVIKDPTVNCGGGACVAEHVPGISAISPTAIAASGVDMLFIAETPNSSSSILRYTISTNTEDLYASNGILPDTSTVPFQFATSLSLDPAGNLFVGDDPTNGVQLLQGHMWQIAAGSPPEAAGQPGVPPAPPPSAALTTGVLYASAITSPGGSVMMDDHVWVADHALGFCRLDADAAPSTTFHINQNFCNLAAVSPGQPTFDATNNFVYVPDNSAKSQGVWRLTFNPATQTVGSPVLLANGNGGLTGNKATATTLAPNGDLYVGFVKNGNILKITNPAGVVTSQVVTTIGKTSDGRGVSAITFVGADLYLAESNGVTVIRNAGTCGGACVAEPVPGISAIGPTAITSDGANLLYIADTPNTVSSILRYSISTGTEVVFATASDTGTSFKFVSGLSLDPAGNLFVGDDPTGGVQILQGHIWKVTPVPAP